MYYTSDDSELEFEICIAEITKKKTTKNKKGQRLKILTPNQMLIGLPITLA